MIEIFIDIILYLLLALAFFSKYFIKKNENKEAYVTTNIILIFIFGIFALICLTIAYILKFENILWPYLFMTPFILTILHTLIRMFYEFLLDEERAKKGWSLIPGCITIIGNLCKRRIFILIFIIMAVIGFFIVSPSIEILTIPIILGLAIFCIVLVIINIVLLKLEHQRKK